MIAFIFSMIAGSTGFLVCELMTRGLVRFRKPKINRTEWKWNAVKDCAIPIEDYVTTPNISTLLISDGEQVDTMHACTQEYDSKGRRVWGFRKKVITHWAYLPSPPETTSLKVVEKK